MIKKKIFRENELVLVERNPPPALPIGEGEVVHLASGGPPMRILAIVDGRALCTWDVRMRDYWFPVRCLRRPRA